jgi:hypothetical protein
MIDMRLNKITIYSSLTLVAVIATVAIYRSYHDSFRFRSAPAAISAYSRFHERIKKSRATELEELVKLYGEWKTLGDTVRRYVAHDTLATSVVRFCEINDSISMEMERLVDSRQRTYRDYLRVMKLMPRSELDNPSKIFCAELNSNYHQSDTMPTYGLGKSETVARYITLLSRTLDSGIPDKAALFSYLRSEDTAFRSFLCNLPLYGDMSLLAIKEKTDEVAMKIVSIPTTKSPFISRSEAVILLTMRNNRRVLQNAVRCVEDIRTGRISETDQQTAYLWMLMQPWMTIDSFAYGLLTKEQTETLERLAAEMPQTLKRLSKAQFPMDTDQIPNTLIKISLRYQI